MPCDTRIPRGMTEAQRLQQIQDSIARLEERLADMTTSVIIGPDGAIAFSNWQDRDGVADVCAYRALATKGSFALQQAVQRAEIMQGRKVNERAVMAGRHSHDGGKTWHDGH